MTLLVQGLSFTNPAIAAEKKVPTPHLYQGAYWSLEGLAGISVASGDESGLTPTGGAALRVASIMSLLDIQLAVMGGKGLESTNGKTSPPTQIDLTLSAQLHPFFLSLLRDTRLHYWIAGLYISGGVGLSFTQLDEAQEPDLSTDVSGYLGLGTDIPLTNPAKGWSIWLGLAYRHRFLTVTLPTIPEGRNMNAHQLLISIGYRNNNIFKARLPLPRELDYRNPSNRN